MSAALSPRALVHRGVVEASGLAFDVDLIGLRTARDRLLAWWTPGCSVSRASARGAGELLILRFGAPVRLVVRDAPGTPLVSSGALLIAAPLSEEEGDELLAPDGAVVLVRGGEAVVIAPSSMTPEDPAAWIDLDELEVLRVESLGAPPKAPELAIEPVAPLSRERFGELPPADPEAARVAAALAGHGVPSEAPRGEGAWRALLEGVRAGLARVFGRRSRAPGDLASRDGGASPASSPATRVGFRRWLASLFGARGGGGAPSAGASPRPQGGFFRRLASLIGGRRGGGGSSRAPSGEAPEGLAIEREGPARGAPFGEWLSKKIDELLTRLALMARLSRTLGARHARYLGDMMDMFERGDLDRALRHAIPLSKKGALADDLRPPSLQLPSPRSRLALTGLDSPGGGQGLFVAPDLFEELRRLYRRAFERLEREGRIEEAAFVLAELLEATEEAIDFLERHGRLRLSAELAEARKMPPGLIIRQWFLAGDLDRALAIARTSGAFAEAVLRLERQGRVEAKKLRLLWADSLAESGDFAAAAEAIWPVEDARPLARRWIDLGIEQGGVAGARLLVRKAVLVPDAAAEVIDRGELILLDESNEDVRVRSALGASILEIGGDNPVLQVLARAATRALLRDRARGFTRENRATLLRLAGLSGERALAVDMPLLPDGEMLPPAWPAANAPQLPLVIRADDTGTLAVKDLARLPDGRLLVALGEAGVQLLGPGKRKLAHFDVPAHRLVLSDHGARAIAVAPRGEAAKLSRIDLGARRAAAWCLARVDTFAPSYDGSLWFVSENDAVLAIDALGQRFRALWRVDRIGAPVRAIARSAAACSFAAGGEPIELWRYSLPGPTLRERVPFPATAAAPGTPGLTAEGLAGAMFCRETHHDPILHLVVADGRTGLHDIGFFNEAPAAPPALFGRWIAITTRAARGHAGLIVRLIDATHGRVHLELSLAGATEAAVRLSPHEMWIGDDRGRVLGLDLERGVVIGDLRL